jgi:hypothetical protein
MHVEMLTGIMSGVAVQNATTLSGQGPSFPISINEYCLAESSQTVLRAPIGKLLQKHRCVSFANLTIGHLK